jgi:hypothetical protein
MAVQNASAVAITGGAFNGTVGATTPSSGVFNALSLAANTNGDTSTTVTNATAGTVASAGFRAYNDLGLSSGAALGQSSSAFTPSGILLADQARVVGFGAGGLALLTTTTSPIIFGPNLTERMRISSAGNVGVGTASPSAPLEVADATSNKGIQITSGAGSSALNFYTTDATAGNRNWRIANRFNTAGSLDFMYGASIGVAPNTLAMTINNSGSVGIGVTNPSAQLHTTGTVRFAGISGVGTSGCLGNDTSGNITGGNPCTGTGFPSGGVKGDIAYYSAASTGAATKASDANIVIQGGDPSGAATSTAAAVLAYAYSKRIVLPPAPGGATGTYKFSTDVTFPTGTELIVPCGVTLAPDSGKFVRNLGVTKAEYCTIVSGAGVVSLGRDVKADWWPSTGGNDTLAINAADASTNNASALSFTGSISTTTLTVTAVSGGFITVGKPITGAGVTAGTIVTALGSGAGETGTYTVSVSQTVGSEAMTGDSADGSENIIRLSCRTYTIATGIVLHANLKNPQQLVGCGQEATILSASGGTFSSTHKSILQQAGMKSGVGNDLMQFTWRDFIITCSAAQDTQGITLGSTTNAIRSGTKNVISRVRVSGCLTGLGWYNTRVMRLEDLYIDVRGDLVSTAAAILIDFDDANQFNGDSDIVRGQFICSNNVPTGGLGYGIRMKSEGSGTNISGIRVNGAVFYECNKMVNATWASTGTMGDHWFYGGGQCEVCGTLLDYSGNTGATKAAMIRFDEWYQTNSFDMQFTGVIDNGAGGAGTTLTISAIDSTFTVGPLQVGMLVGASAITGGTIITNVGTCAGPGAPTLPCTATVNNSQNRASQSMYANTTDPKFRLDGGTTDEIVDVSIRNVRVRGCRGCRFIAAAKVSQFNVYANQIASYDGSSGNPNELISLTGVRKAIISNNNVDAFGISGAVPYLVTASGSSTDIIVSNNNARDAVSATWNASSVTNECISVTNLPHTALSGC